MAFGNTDERVDTLEAALTSFIRHTTEGIAEMRRANEESRRGAEEMRRGIEETRHSIEEMRRGNEEFRAEIRQDIAEMRQWRIQAQKQWGEITQKMGTFVEDIVAPNIPHLGREVFKLGGTNEELFSGPRLRLRHPSDPSRMREFDYVYATERGWVVVASKTDPKLKDIDLFREMLSEVREYFPQYAQSPLKPVFASLYIPEHVADYCTRHGIYALGMGPETMQILNLPQLLASGASV
ncbi:MAG: hypothetical protein FJ403_08935 [Verrucomicrobia bacterium]|nr:hypothetical protein [Verrucomicrobiota bacterium]